VHTVGGVITAGDATSYDRAEGRRLVRSRPRSIPQDIDKLQVGQKTVLRLSAFNQRTTPELNGVVTRVSADVTTEQRTGPSLLTPSASRCRRKKSPASTEG